MSLFPRTFDVTLWIVWVVRHPSARQKLRNSAVAAQTGTQKRDLIA